MEVGEAMIALCIGFFSLFFQCRATCTFILFLMGSGSEFSSS